MSWSLYYNGPASGAMLAVAQQGAMAYPLASPAEDATRAAAIATVLAAAASMPGDAPFSASANGYETQEQRGDGVVARRQYVSVTLG